MRWPGTIVVSALLSAVLLSRPAAAQEIGTQTGGGPDGSPAGERLVATHLAYDEGLYEEAADGYRSLLAAGHDSAHLHYNLGNALLRQGRLGPAIASFRRAQLRAPRDEDIAANLAYARQTAEDDLVPPDASETQKTLFFWHYALSSEELWRTLLVSNVLLFAVLAVRAFRRSDEWSRWAALALLVPLFFSAGSLGWRELRPVRVAIVAPQEARIYSGARTDTAVRFLLHAGSEVLVTDDREGWLRIVLPDGQQGWLPADDAEVVDL